ncbi:flagellin [Paenibacillus sp. N4]|uniref:flagellin N-terminal helical domain-containing protein n=1 Tax=Paenibacillus vietnamensis TaxID=2590547 RepID=UPI001CD0B180|nr:flagellin [Paenibacillus vietnamensis]MCA0757556.1 flagellin [Paenibacillus vietnamensis]
MRINHNIGALNTHRQLGVNTANQSKSIEKLSSGLRINRAGDDAAGLAISEKMRGQIRGLDQASRNAQDGISLIQTAEGALNETHSILQRMNELATQAANETLSTNDRNSIADEITQLNSEIDRISTSTKFNGETLLDGTFGVQLDATSGLEAGSDGVVSIDIGGTDASTTYTIAVGSGGAGTVALDDGNGNIQEIAAVDGTAGTLNFDKLGVKITVNGTWTAAGLAAANNGGGGAGTVITTADAAKNIQIGSENDVSQRLGVTIAKIDSTAGSLNTASIDVTSAANARTAMDTIQTAIDTVSRERSKLGAYQNRLEHTINNLNTSSENLTAAESRIRDVDMAKEMMEQTKNSILAQASQAMLAQANQQPQGVLQLLR